MLQPGRPRHEQISDWLRDQIEKGVYQPNDQLPSESQLGARFGVSRITVRRALQTLESDGVIYRQQGLGSFARKRHVRQGLVRLTDFVEDMEQSGIQATSRVVHRAEEPASAAVAGSLQIEERQPVLRLDRLRLGDDEPIAFDRTWLPRFYAHLLEAHDLEHDSIYRILERSYDIPVLRGRFRIEAVNSDADVARHLQIPPGRALLLIERTSMTYGGRRIYFQQRYYRSDRVAYEMELERDPASAQTPGMPLQEFEPVFKPSR